MGGASQQVACSDGVPELEKGDAAIARHVNENAACDDAEHLGDIEALGASAPDDLGKGNAFEPVSAVADVAERVDVGVLSAVKRERDLVVRRKAPLADRKHLVRVAARVDAIELLKLPGIPLRMQWLCAGKDVTGDRHAQRREHLFPGDEIES